MVLEHICFSLAMELEFDFLVFSNEVPVLVFVVINLLTHLLIIYLNYFYSYYIYKIYYFLVCVCFVNYLNFPTRRQQIDLLTAFPD